MQLVKNTPSVGEGSGEELSIIDGHVGEELLAAPDLLGQLLDEELGVGLVPRGEDGRLSDLGFHTKMTSDLVNVKLYTP